MAAGIYNFTIEQGATFTKNFTWLDSNNAAVNLTGWSARIQCRASIGSTATIFSYTSRRNADSHATYMPASTLLRDRT